MVIVWIEFEGFCVPDVFLCGFFRMRCSSVTPVTGGFIWSVVTLRSPECQKVRYASDCFSVDFSILRVKLSVCAITQRVLVT